MQFHTKQKPEGGKENSGPQIAEQRVGITEEGHSSLGVYTHYLPYPTTSTRVSAVLMHHLQQYKKFERTTTHRCLSRPEKHAMSMQMMRHNSDAGEKRINQKCNR